jgi:peroxiredoxin
MLQAASRSPAFSLTDLSAKRLASSELLADGPLVLAFYKSSCPVCQLTLPFLDRVAQAGMRIIGVSQDKEADTERFRERFNLSMPFLLDRAEDGYPASNGFGITNVPSLFLIESDGTILTSTSGFSKAYLEDLGKRAGVTVFRPEEKVPEWKAG